MSAQGNMRDSGTSAPSPATGKIAGYVEEVELYDKSTQKWNNQCKKILRRYKDDRGGDGTIESQQRRFNVLWANTQTLKPALYARNPKPDIQRRFKDADPIGRVTSDVLERCVTYFTDTDRFFDTVSQSVTDYILPGRGTLWVRYVPHFKQAAEITDDVTKGDDAEAQQEAPEVIDYEEVASDYVHRKDFGHNIARTWEEVWLVWRIVYLTRPEMRARFNKPVGDGTDRVMGDLPPLDYKKENSEGKAVDDAVGKSVIYECWDKTRKLATWFHRSIPDALDQRPDPLRLADFFPTPKPLMMNLVNDSLIPVPLYVEYQDQAAELDNLTMRIANITKAIKVAGVHDASAEGLQRLMNEGTENELIPIQSWTMFAEKGGLKGTIDLLPMKDIAATLLSLYDARDRVKRDLDEITGMSDIVRGNTDPNETARAQSLKASYSNQRISDLQRDVQRYIRETIRLMVDIISTHFQMETIKQISGVRLLTQQEKQAFQAASQPPPIGHNGGPPMQGPAPAGVMAGGSVPPSPPPLPPGVTPEQMQDMMEAPTWEEVEGLIHNNAMRCFRIDIETDSTIKMDEDAEKQSRVEFLTAAGGFLEKAVTAGQAQPAIVPLLCQMLMFGVRAFPVGKELEGAFNSALQKLEKEAANPQPRPDPEMIKIQGQMQIEQQKEQNSQQRAVAEINAKQQAEIAEAAAKAQTDQHLNQLEAERRALELRLEDQAAQRAAEREAQQQQAEWAHEERLAEINARRDITIAEKKAFIAKEQAIEVARINAAATTGEEEEARAVSEVDDTGAIVAPAKPPRDDEMHGKMDDLIKVLVNMAQKPQQDLTSHIQAMAQAQTKHGEAIGNLHKAVTAEREIVRDPKTGKPSGVRVKVAPDKLGKALQ